MTVEISDRSEESDLQGIRRLLRRKVKPTALFANNDYTAANAMSVAKALGMAVPADLAVVGYDNSYLSPDWIHRSVHGRQQLPGDGHARRPAACRANPAAAQREASRPA
jgi:hypothetical protein